MSPPTARRVAGFEQSFIRQMTRECERVGGINLGQGMCDLPLLPAIEHAAAAAVSAGKNQYAPAHGVSELRRAIASKLRRHNAIDIDPERELVVTSGATGA